MNLEAIEPLAKLGIELVSAQPDQVVFQVPLVGNRNDKGTLFAGSQYSGLVLAGWYLASQWATAQGLGDKVAVKDAQVSYPNAAYSNVTITAEFLAPPDQRPSGHWRANIRVVAVDDDGKTVSDLTGDYRILTQ